MRHRDPRRARRGLSALAIALPLVIALGGPACSSTPASAPRAPLTISFDYRYDTRGFFADPARRATLEAAARVWTSRLHDTFPRTPAGSKVLLVQPESQQPITVELAADHEGVLVFVGANVLADHVGGQAGPGGTPGGAVDDARRALQDRLYADDFEPFVGSLTFSTVPTWFVDPTPETEGDAPAGQADLLSIATPELGHVLGFGTAPRFLRLTEDEALSLSPDRYHFLDSAASGARRPCMYVSPENGRRSVPTALDLEVFAAMGYEP